MSEKDGKFVGLGGWGDGGAITEIEVDTDYILGRIKSDALQHG